MCALIKPGYHEHRWGHNSVKMRGDRRTVTFTITTDQINHRVWLFQRTHGQVQFNLCWVIHVVLRDLRFEEIDLDGRVWIHRRVVLRDAWFYTESNETNTEVFLVSLRNALLVPTRLLSLESQLISTLRTEGVYATSICSWSRLLLAQTFWHHEELVHNLTLTDWLKKKQRKSETELAWCNFTLPGDAYFL